MTAIKADVYFEQNKERAGEALFSPVVEARRVTKGDRMVIGGGLKFMTRAQEDGWVVEDPSGSDFVNDLDFGAKFTPYEDNPTEELPAGTEVKPVSKGDRIFTRPFADSALGVVGNAECDGFLVTPAGTDKPRFVSEAFFRATFKNDLPPVARNPDQGYFRFATPADEKPLRYVVLTQEVTFDFKQGPYKAEVGSVLFENPADEDGYTLFSHARFMQDFIVKKTPIAPAVNFRPSGPK